MSTAAAKPKARRARTGGGDAADTGRGPVPPTPTDAKRERREFAAAPERVERRHAEALVLKAVHLCRPGTQRGTASPLWKGRQEGGIGYGGVYEAAQLYLIDHLSAEQVRVRLAIPAPKARALDRLLYNIQEAHTGLLLADVEARASSAATAPIEGDVVALGLHFASQLIRQTAADIGAAKWSEMDQADRHTTLRLAEWVSDIVKSASTAQHREAQTERIERMLRREVDEAEKTGTGTIDASRVRTIIDEALGLRRAGGAA